MRTAQAISLPLEDVYVELRAIGEVPEAADTFSVEERRLLLEVDEDDEHSKQELMRQLDTLRKDRWSRVSVDRKINHRSSVQCKDHARLLFRRPWKWQKHLFAFACARLCKRT